MSRAAVQNAEPHASNPVGREVPLAVVAVGFANEKPARCIALPVQVVGMRRKCLFSRAMTDQSIAAIVTNPRVLVAQMTDARAGNLHDGNYSESR